MNKPIVMCCGFFESRHKTLVNKLSEDFDLCLVACDGVWQGMQKLEIGDLSIAKDRINEAGSIFWDFITAIENKFSLRENKEIKNQVIEYILRLWMECETTQEKAFQLYKKRKIAAILAVNDQLGPIRAMVDFGKKRNIPTVYIEHGFSITSFKASCLRIKNKPELPITDIICVDNELQKKEYHDFYSGKKSSPKIYVTGNPLDGRSKFSTSKRKIQKQKPKKSTILFCPSWFEANSIREVLFGNELEDSAFRQFCAMAKELIKQKPEIKFDFVVKLHPTMTKTLGIDTASYYNQVANEFDVELSEIDDGPIANWLRKADLLVTSRNSSVVWEAFLHKVPCLTYISDFYKQLLKPDSWEKPTCLAEWGIQVYLDEKENWAFHANSFLESKWCGEFSTLCERHNSLFAYIDAKKAVNNVVRVVKNSQKDSDFDIKPPKFFKILHIVHDFPPQGFSGTELYTLNLSKELSKLGHTVSVLYPVKDTKKQPFMISTAEYDGVPVFKFNTYYETEVAHSDFLNTAFDAPFRTFLSENDFDIIHFQHLYGLSANWIEIAKEHGLLVFMKIDDMFMYCRQVHLMQNGKDFCSGPESIDKCYKCLHDETDKSMPDEIAQVFYYLAFRREILRKAFKQVDFIHSPSRFLKKTCIENEFSNKEFHVLPTGIAPFNIIKKEESDLIRIGYMGEIHFRKGISTFLEAIRIFNDEKKNKSGNLKFKIYGNHFNDNLYRTVIKTVDLLDDVRYYGGFVPDERLKIFSEIDLFVLPSLGENYPFVLREALYAGVPVIATKIAGVPEIVMHEKNGFLVSPGDASALAEIFCRISDNPEIIANLNPHFKNIKVISLEAKEIEKFYFEFYKKQLNSLSEIDLRVIEAKKKIDNQQIKEGLELLSSVINIAPQHAKALKLMGYVYQKLGKVAEAERIRTLVEK